MRKARVISAVVTMVLVIALFGASTMAQAASPASGTARLRRTPTPTPPRPTPTPTTPPPAVCWAVVAGPDLAGPGAELRDVAGSSDNDLWAVGWYDDASYVRHTLIVHWNGSSWHVTPSPDAVTTGSNLINALNGVTVIAPNDVWAVGYGVSLSVPYKTITLHWDGNTWTLIPSPNVATPGAYNALNSVTAVASNDVWAVGGVPAIDLSSVSGRSVLMHWDGTAWSLVPEPPETATWSSTTRTAVAARASNDVYAGGQYSAWHWDGTAWHVPSSFSGQNLTDVNANGGALWSIGTNPGVVISEGGYVPPSPNAQWFDGATWHSTTPINPGNGAGFNAVKISTPNAVWAVGYKGQFALAEKWNGTQWTEVVAANGNPTPPSNRSIVNILRGINGASSTGLWAVGSYYDSAGVQRILIERYTCQ